MPNAFRRSVILFPSFIFALASFCAADTVIMKDGTVYKGKIQIDTDKAILIGNPPFDPTSYLLQSEDIDKIIYEEYRPEPPSVRRRGWVGETSVTGNFFSSNDMTLKPAGSLYAGLGFRLHPFFEIDGGATWTPSMTSRQPFSITDDQQHVLREYSSYYQWGGEISGRFYPFFKKVWKTEPYFSTGYGWDRRIPSGSGDIFHGAYWILGIGAIRPLTTHLFLDARLMFRSDNFSHLTFQNQDATLTPSVGENDVALTGGLSYRL